MAEARYIPPDAGPFERFQVGDSVAHITLGDGKVTRNNGEYIVVCLERPGRKRGFYVGEYDARWFQLHPRYLFHRGNVSPSEIAK